MNLTERHYCIFRLILTVGSRYLALVWLSVFFSFWGEAADPVGQAVVDQVLKVQVRMSMSALSCTQSFSRLGNEANCIKQICKSNVNAEEYGSMPIDPSIDKELVVEAKAEIIKNVDARLKQFKQNESKYKKDWAKREDKPDSEKSVAVSNLVLAFTSLSHSEFELSKRNSEILANIMATIQKSDSSLEFSKLASAYDYTALDYWTTKDALSPPEESYAVILDSLSRLMPLANEKGAVATLVTSDDLHYVQTRSPTDKVEPSDFERLRKAEINFRLSNLIEKDRSLVKKLARFKMISEKSALVNETALRQKLIDGEYKHYLRLISSAPTKKELEQLNKTLEDEKIKAEGIYHRLLGNSPLLSLPTELGSVSFAAMPSALNLHQSFMYELKLQERLAHSPPAMNSHALNHRHRLHELGLDASEVLSELDVSVPVDDLEILSRYNIGTNRISINRLMMRSQKARQYLGHELGHAVSNLSQHDLNLNAVSRSKLEKVQTCLRAQHLNFLAEMPTTTNHEEDFADLILGNTTRESSNFFCDFQTKDYHLQTQNIRDIHSSDYFRLLHLEFLKKGKLPAICLQRTDHQRVHFENCLE